MCYTYNLIFDSFVDSKKLLSLIFWAFWSFFCIKIFAYYDIFSMSLKIFLIFL